MDCSRTQKPEINTPSKIFIRTVVSQSKICTFTGGCTVLSISVQKVKFSRKECRFQLRHQFWAIPSQSRCGNVSNEMVHSIPIDNHCRGNQHTHNGSTYTLTLFPLLGLLATLLPHAHTEPRCDPLCHSCSHPPGWSK